MVAPKGLVGKNYGENCGSDVGRRVPPKPLKTKETRWSRQVVQKTGRWSRNQTRWSRNIPDTTKKK